MGGGAEGMVGLCCWFGKRGGLKGGGFGRSRERAIFSAITHRDRGKELSLTQWLRLGRKIYITSFLGLLELAKTIFSCMGTVAVDL